MKASDYRELLMDEDAECSVLVDHLNELVQQGVVQCYSHVANETYTPSWNAKRKNKLLGVHAGVPDYVIVGKNDILFIEMKRKKGGKPSVEQKKWIAALEYAGIPAVICYGAESAMEAIAGWLA